MDGGKRAAASPSLAASGCFVLTTDVKFLQVTLLPVIFCRMCSHSSTDRRLCRRRVAHECVGGCMCSDPPAQPSAAAAHLLEAALHRPHHPPCHLPGQCPRSLQQQVLEPLQSRVVSVHTLAGSASYIQLVQQTCDAAISVQKRDTSSDHGSIRNTKCT